MSVGGDAVSSIGKGVLVFAAMAPGDTKKDAETLASKVLKLRLWDDEQGGRVLLTADPFQECPQVDPLYLRSNNSCLFL